MSALTAKLNLDPSGLKRGASEASRAIGEISKDLKGLDGDIDRVDGKDARVQVEADIARAEANLKSVKSDLADLDSTVAEPRIEADDPAGSGGNAGDMFGIGAVQAIAGSAIAAAVVTTYDAGMERIQVRARIEQQFGLIEADARRYSQEAGDIYASGWGDSANDVLSSLALIDQKLVATGVIAQHEADNIAEGALVIADVFGKDVTEVIDAVSKLLLNGLAPDAETALDILATGMQDGADGAGDLFESIDEYSQHFDAFGLGAEDMMALFAAGMSNGQRDTDKLADAVKEMRLLMTETGEDVDKVYADLGLSADDFRRAILEGGPAARDAFNQIINALSNVEDDVERNRLGVEVMGTMYEDLGPTALDTFQAMGDGLEDVAGKVDEMNDAMSETQSEVDKLKRDALAMFGVFSEGFAKVTNWAVGNGSIISLPFVGLKAAGDKLIDGTKDLNGELKLTAEQMIAVAREAAIAEATSEGLWDQVIDLSNVTDEYNKEAELREYWDKQSAAATRDATDASDDHTEAIDDERAAVEDLIAEIDTLIESKLDLVGAANDVTRAEIKARDAERDLAEALADGTLTQDEKTLAMLDATDAQVDAAMAAADYEIAQREANGQTVSAATKADIQAAALRDVASTLEPGSMLQNGLLDMADNIDDIPNEVDIAIASNAGIESARMDTLDSKIRNLPDKTIRINTVYTATGAKVKDGTITKDSGGYLGIGQVAQVAERRPEYVTTPTGRQLILEPTMIAGPANVTSGSETARMLASASTAPTTTGSTATGVANSTGGAITVVNSKASASVADVAMAIRMARY